MGVGQYESRRAEYVLVWNIDYPALVDEVVEAVFHNLAAIYSIVYDISAFATCVLKDNAWRLGERRRTSGFTNTPER